MHSIVRVTKEENVLTVSGISREVRDKRGVINSPKKPKILLKSLLFFKVQYLTNKLYLKQHLLP